uniref:Uncharacterized protein n=1 Tax=Lepeophtheirus salmonis TaxID=72036 RepID=A0A0K2THC3_LEPSM
MIKSLRSFCESTNNRRLKDNLHDNYFLEQFNQIGNNLIYVLGENPPTNYLK